MALKLRTIESASGPSPSTGACPSQWVILLLVLGALSGPQAVHAQDGPPPSARTPEEARDAGVDGPPATISPEEPGDWILRGVLVAGFQVGSTPRRTLDLPSSSMRRVWPVVGLELHAGFGPFRIDLAPRLEDRLLDDPDWPSRSRGDDRGIALRTPVARLVGEWRWARVEVGEVERNWGPAGVPGLLLSPLGYSRRGVGFSVGPEVLRLQWRTERLSTEPSTVTGEPAPRWFTVHRLRWRPSERWELAAWEAMVTAEPDGIDPARLNPLALFTFGQQFGIGDERNTSFGFDVAWWATDALRLETQILVDDIVIWKADENPFPHRFGFTAQLVRAPLGGWGWRTWATGLSALALNTFRPEEAFVDEGSGLGRLRPDHLAAGAEIRLRLGGTDSPAQGEPGPASRALVQDSWRLGSPGDGWRPDPWAATPETAEPGPVSPVPGVVRLDFGVRWRRQGRRRFDDPFPRPGSGSEVPDLPTFSPEIETELIALHSGVSWSWGPVDLVGEAQLQHRRYPASDAPNEWGGEARAQLLWRVGSWSYRGR